MTPAALAAVCLAAGQDVAPPPRDLAPLVARLGKLPGELVRAKKADADVVEGLVLAALGRLPTDAEKATGVKFLAGPGDREGRARDFAWALVNTKEFLKLQGMDADPAGALRVLNKLVEKWGKDDEKK
ncbi:MAG: hypothetical protein C0501_22400 [Isosphaera sp.]|nr:hypothetical protein [Isosphaera sp.]